MNTVFLDLETRSHADIKKLGGRVYAEHESTELILGCAMIVTPGVEEVRCVGWSPHVQTDREVERMKWLPKPAALSALGIDPTKVVFDWQVAGNVPSFLLDEAAAGSLFVAHNAEGFDRPVLEAWGFPTEVQWLDTAHRARQSGLPAGLDAIGGALFKHGKDAQGQRTLKKLYKPLDKGPNKGRFLPLNPGNVGQVARYCVIDVALMAAAYFAEGWDKPHEDDAVRELHCKIDRRGVKVDLDAAQRILDEALRQKADWLKRVEPLGLGETELNSSQALLSFAKEHGWHMENLRKTTVESALASLPPGDKWAGLRLALQARLGVRRITEGKARAALEKTSKDGRMRGTLVYWGAHTGRWAGRGLQVQNLPGAVEEFSRVMVDVYDPDVPLSVSATAIEALEEDLLASMIRGVLVAEEGKVLLMVDYAQIEARVLQWLAGNESALDVFRTGRDIYMANGAGIFGKSYEEVAALGKKSVERSVGKIATLALGYQGGPGALQAFAGDFDFEEHGLSADDVVNGWRDTNHLIAGTRKGVWETPEGRVVVTRKGGLWREVQKAAQYAICGAGETEAARCVFRMVGAHLHIVLPSGRPLVYRHATWEPWENGFGTVTKSMVFDGVRFGKVAREATYGGRLVENITQAVARDIMAHAMLALEDSGYPVFFTVHDEIIAGSRGGPEDAESELAEVERIMCDLPAWAAGLPIEAAGEFGPRYRK